MMEAIWLALVEHSSLLDPVANDNIAERVFLLSRFSCPVATREQ